MGSRDRSEGGGKRQRTESEHTDPFFGCYLLTSLKEKCQDHTYIGFTVNPPRRLKQHNGLLPHGAWKTSKKRPWYVLINDRRECNGDLTFVFSSLEREMVMIVYGFPSKISGMKEEVNPIAIAL